MDELINQLFAYLHGLWRYRWSAVLIAWIVAITGSIVVYALPDQYETRTVVYIDTESIMKPLLKGLAVESDSTDELAVMTRMLLSRDSLLAVLRDTDMDLEADTPAEKEELVEELAAAIQLKGDNSGDRKSRFAPKTNIFEIGYTAKSPELAYRVVSKLLNTLIENTLNSGRTDTLMAQRFLDRQIREYEERLSAAEQRLANFKKENLGMMPGMNGNYFDRLQNGIDAAEETRRNLALAKQQLAELEKQLSGESPITGGSDFDQYAAEKLRSYREELALLQSQYTSSHPDVLAMKARIRDLERNGVPRLETGSDDADYNPVYQELKAQEGQLKLTISSLEMQLAEREKELDQVKKSVDAMPQVEARLAKLNRDYEITRQRYLDLVERRESARLAQEAGQNSSDINFRVIEPPVVPARPSGPNRPLLLVGVLFAALVAGFGWMVLRFLLHPTFVDYKQLRNAYDFPVLGSVSLYMTPQHKRKRRLQAVSFLLVTILLLGGFGGAVYYNEQGAEFVKAAMSRYGFNV